MTDKPKFEHKFEYDERRKVLNSIVKKELKGLTGEYKDVYDEEGIKRLHKEFVNDKTQTQKAINNIEKMISNLKEKIEELSKETPKLTGEQKTLMENIKVLQKVQPLEDTKTQLTQKEEVLENLKKDLKDKNKTMNELVSKVKFKLD